MFIHPVEHFLQTAPNQAFSAFPSLHSLLLSQKALDYSAILRFPNRPCTTYTLPPLMPSLTLKPSSPSRSHIDYIETILAHPHDFIFTQSQTHPPSVLPNKRNVLTKNPTQNSEPKIEDPKSKIAFEDREPES